MGTFLNPEYFKRQAKSLPLKMPPRLPIYYSDFGCESDLEHVVVEQGSAEVDGKGLRVYASAGAFGVVRLTEPRVADFTLDAEVYPDVIYLNADKALIFRVSEDLSKIYAFGIQLWADSLDFGKTSTGKTGAWSRLNYVAFTTEARWYRLTVKGVGEVFDCLLDGELIFTVSDPDFPSGYVGVATDGYWPGTYAEMHVRRLLLYR